MKARALLFVAVLMGIALYHGPTICRDCRPNLQPWDLAVNWTASYGMRHGVSVYDSPQQNALAQQRAGQWAQPLFNGDFLGYIGPPSTALIILPFTFSDFDTAVALYRLTMIVLFAISIFLVGLTLPSEYRWRGWLIGGVAIIFSYPIKASLELGQVDGFVVLGLAMCIWATHRRYWYIAGAGGGFAALLKISPVLLLAYLVIIHRKWKAAIGAFVTGLSLLGLATVVGRSSDVLTFVRIIVPDLWKGSAYVQNQSLPGWVARLAMNDPRFMTAFGYGLGSYRWVGSLFMAGILLFSSMTTRRDGVQSLGLGLLILGAVLAGPLSWDSYPSWTVLTLVLLMDGRYWQRLTANTREITIGLMTLGMALTHIPILAIEEGAIARQWLLRLSTGSMTVGLLISTLTVGFLLYRYEARVAKSERTGATS